MALTCRTCGGAPGHHRPSMLDPSGVGDPGHRMTGSKPCETCGGRGLYGYGQPVPCSSCNGTGEQPESGILKLAPDELAGLAGEAADKSAETMNAMLDLPTPPQEHSCDQLVPCSFSSRNPQKLAEHVAAEHQPTPPSTEDELEVAITRLRKYSQSIAFEHELNGLAALARREQHRHTAEVLKTIRSAAGIDGSALAHMNMLDAAIAAEEQAMKGEKA